VLDPMLEQLLPGFVEESAEICERATRNLLELERRPASGPRFDDLARGLHTLKGSAATLGLVALSAFAHKMEDAVLPLRGSDQPLPPNLADAVLRSLDVWLAHLRATVTRSEPPDLRPSYALLAKASKHSAAEPAAAAEKAAEENAQVKVAEAAPESGEASWRVATRQVTSLMREVERLREVRLRLDERRRERGAETFLRERECELGVGEHVAEPLGGHRRIERHVTRARFQDAKNCDEHLE